MYTWKGITKITAKEAEIRFSEDKEVYLLYDDGTEGAATNLEEIERHNKACGEFGYENNLDTIIYDVCCCICGRTISLGPDEKASIDIDNWKCQYC